MSSDEPADDDEALGPVRFIRMRAEDTFDGQERVMSRAASDLQVRATAHSVSCSHPGFVPDDYLEHLDGLGIETTITAAELCTVGMWQRIDGGYRLLDWEAVEVCLDRVRQINGEDARALAWEREREAKIRAQMARPMVVTPPCAVCGTPSARVELVAPGHVHKIISRQGHESLESAMIYIHADMALKQRALDRTAAPGTTPDIYQPADSLLAFLTAL